MSYYFLCLASYREDIRRFGFWVLPSCIVVVLAFLVAMVDDVEVVLSIVRHDY